MDTTPQKLLDKHARHVISARASSSTEQHEHHWHLPEGGWPSLLETSMQEVFEMMLGTPVSCDPNPQSLPGASLTAMIGLAGDLCGVLSIRCSTETACKLVAKMLGSDPAMFDETAMDALAEICNMTAGTLKSKVPGLDDRCLLSIPTVIHGREYRLHSVANGERSEVTLKFEGEILLVALELHG